MRSGIRQPTEEELKVINDHFSKRPLTAEELYCFDIDAANSDTVTAYYSRLGADMIEGFAKDVNAKHTDPKALSVGYLFGHNDQMIPSGTLFKAALETENVLNADQSSRIMQRFKPTVFMLKNLNVGGINTDDYIRAYEAGHTEDCSVGFLAAEYKCDICGFDIRDFWHCAHSPGRSYVMNKDEVAMNGATPIVKQCTYTVHQGYVKDHNLMELSGVYRGAMWGSRIESQGLKVTQDGEMRKIVDKDNKLVASTNIKDFKPEDVLRFNFHFQGSIDKVGTTGEEKTDADQAVAIMEKIKKVETANLGLQEQVTDITGQLVTLNTEAVQLRGEKTVLEGKLADCGKNLGLSEADKSELEKQVKALELDVSARDERIKELESAKKELEVIVVEYRNGLEERCRKLSVAINGDSFDEKLLLKEISALSNAELQGKNSALEAQLAKMIPIVRQTVQTDKVHFGLNNRGVTTQPTKPELHKIK